MADTRGNIFEVPGLSACGARLGIPFLPDPDDFSPLPEGSEIFALPGRIPVGYDQFRKKFVSLKEVEGEPVSAVAGFPAPAHIQHANAAYMTLAGAPVLPFFTYSAVGWWRGRIVAAVSRIDPDSRQDFSGFDPVEIEKAASDMLCRHPGNRFVSHLVENCVRRYACPAARNLVLGRFEAPIPVSRTCNASCIGCISHQDSETGVCAPQERIKFTPEPGEIIEVIVSHLERAKRAVASFGQGCEGEPLMESELIKEVITGIRKRTKKGIINLNTNGSLPDHIQALFTAGLDSIRVSMNSAQKDLYLKYHRPKGYMFEDVIESLKIARRLGRWFSINYFICPGLTDHPEEMDAFFTLAKTVQMNMVQTRNLSMDPVWYASALGIEGMRGAIGIRAWIAKVKEKLPWLKLGYFNPPAEDMGVCHYPDESR